VEQEWSKGGPVQALKTAVFCLTPVLGKQKVNKVNGELPGDSGSKNA
jgi:hypothetical protein